MWAKWLRSSKARVRPSRSAVDTSAIDTTDTRLKSGHSQSSRWTKRASGLSSSQKGAGHPRATEVVRIPIATKLWLPSDRRRHRQDPLFGFVGGKGVAWPSRLRWQLRRGSEAGEDPGRASFGNGDQGGCFRSGSLQVSRESSGVCRCCPRGGIGLLIPVKFEQVSE